MIITTIKGASKINRPTSPRAPHVHLLAHTICWHPGPGRQAESWRYTWLHLIQTVLAKHQITTTQLVIIRTKDCTAKKHISKTHWNRPSMPQVLVSHLRKFKLDSLASSVRTHTLITPVFFSSSHFTFLPFAISTYLFVSEKQFCVPTD